MRQKLFTIAQLHVIALTLTAVLGCEEPQPVGTQNAASPATSATSATSPATDETAISPKLIATVEELVRLHKKYTAIAAKIQTSADFRTQIKTLLAIEQRTSLLGDDIMIARAKLSPSQYAEFQSKYYESFSKPAVAEMRLQRQRIYALSM